MRGRGEGVAMFFGGNAMGNAGSAQPTLTKEQSDRLFMLLLEEDGPQASRSAMGDLTFWAVSSFVHSLRGYAYEHDFGWYVTAFLPVSVTLPPSSQRYQIYPDAFVAFASARARQTFDVPEEGGFPPFVLDVTSPPDVEGAEHEKRSSYELLGVREYALFTPRDGRESKLEGYRRDDAGQFAPWLTDAQGRLWSETLGLFLVVRGPLLQAETAAGDLLLTPEQSGAALRSAEAAREQEAIAHEQETAAREEAEAEIERLRQELARLRGERGE